MRGILMALRRGPAFLLLQHPSMKLDIEIQGQATEVELGDGTHTLGGDPADGVHVPGLAAALFELRILGDRLLVRSAQAYPVEGVLSPSNVARLVLPDERVGLGEGITLRLRADEARAERPGTAGVLRELLGGLDEPGVAQCAFLICLTGLDVGRRYPLAGPQLVMGRGETVDLRIRDRAVSRQHARLQRQDPGYTIEDLGAPNGLFVNGRRACGPTFLADGAVVEMGHSLLRFRDLARPLPAAITSPPVEVSEAAEAPVPAPAVQPSPPSRPRRRVRMEHALLGLGVCLALLGVLVTWNFVAAAP
jgi:hypothetical protein